ncbi:hypothetical protein [Planktothrix prolifica]
MVIGRNVWIGANVMIIPGVSLEMELLSQ